MLLSLFTPTHRPIHLTEVYKSFLRQEGDIPWEWVIVPNGTDVIIPSAIRNDSHVRIVPSDLKGIGALKRFACSQCSGDVLIEMDHDDTLAPTCFQELATAYNKTPNGFYYSDFINLKEDGKCETYGPRFGWSSYHTTIENRGYVACSAFEPTARSLCHIFYAPNHVRAWSRIAYDASGGHASDLFVGDDHDLLCRTYTAGVPFIWIKKPLYIYRRWKSQSFIEFNKEIQKQQQDTCNKYLHKLILSECSNNDWPTLDIGPQEWCPSSFTSFNFTSKSGLATSSVGAIRAVDAFQRVPRSEIVPMMNELYRVLRPGGWLITATPAIDDGKGKMGRGAFQDPSHCSYWSENNFRYFTEKKYASMLTDYSGRFQSVRLWTDYPSEFHEQNYIPYVSSDLCALKGQRQPGACDI